MPLDTSIALNARLPQIESPLNQMANFASMRQAQQTNALNELKMQETQRGMAENEAVRNYLASKNYNSPDFDTGLFAISPTQGTASMKTRAELAKDRALTGKTTAETKKTEFETKKTELETNFKKLEVVGNTFSYVSKNPTPQAVAMALKYLVTNGIIDQAQADEQLSIVAQDPSPTNIKMLADQGFAAVLSANDHLPKFYNQENVMVNGVPTTRLLEVPSSGGRATTVEGSTGATYNKPAANINVTTNLPEQEKEFEKALGKGQADKVLASKVAAEDAAKMLATNRIGKNLLDKGMLTGVGAEFFTTLNQALNQAGMDFGKADAAQNSQAYGALMAANTAKIIKAFGAGTGLSDADRIYALKAAGGEITMDEKAIRKILEFNDIASKAVINKHNKDVAGVKTNIPLSVDIKDYTAGIPEGRTEKDTRKPLKDIFKKPN